MPSRRTFLRIVGVVTVGGFAGCTAFDRGDEGYIQRKSITGVRSEDGREVWEPVIRVTLSSPAGADSPQLSYIDEDDEWADRFDTRREPVVSDALHDKLRRAYDAVRYVVGVCCPAWADGEEESVGCYNVSTTRENFNAVQVHDRVTASSDGTSLTIHSVDGTWTFDSE